MQMKSPLFSRALFCAALLTAPILTSCGGSTNSAPLPLSVNISPNSVNLAAGQAQTFVAIINGSNNTKVNWSVLEGAAGGAITDVGAYRAPMSPGTFHVVATSMADSTKSASATVIVPPISVAISPSTVTVTSGETRTFTAVVTGSLDQMVTWRVQEGSAGGAITDVGLYTAPTVLGTYHVIATSSADPNKNALAAVAVLQSGFFKPTGSMGSARGGQTATLLPNGKVLVAGGGKGGPDLLEPFTIGELYDPATGSFTSTGGTRRELHSATLLPNGKVLVVGGIDNVTFPAPYPGVTATAELYDPATGAFTPTGSMATPRFSHTATLLPNGEVLVTGGLNVSVPAPNWGDVGTAELYDPTTGTFTPTGSMATARGLHTATLLANGKVLVVGGSSGSLSTLASAEIYDPAMGSFTPAGNLGTARRQHAATLLPNDKVLVTGGDVGRLATAELYDPATGSFTLTGSMAAGRGEHTATLLQNGKVLVAGGLDQNGVGITTVELYDPATGSFTPAGSMAGGRGEHTATLLQNGNVLATGGLSSGFGVADTGTEIATAEVYEH